MKQGRRERSIWHRGFIVGDIIHEGKQSWRVSIEGAPQSMYRERFRSRRTAQVRAMTWLEENHKVTREQEVELAQKAQRQLEKMITLGFRYGDWSFNAQER